MVDPWTLFRVAALWGPVIVVIAVILGATLPACAPKGACVLATRARSGGASEVCFWQSAATCAATPPVTPGEPPPAWTPGQTCSEAGFRCAGIGFATGSRRVQPDGTCPRGSDGPW